MISQPRRISSRDWAIGLPCSSVIATAISSTRARMMPAALMMISARLAGDVRRQTLKPCSAAATAAARSACVACGTVPTHGLVGGIDDGLAVAGNPLAADQQLQLGVLCHVFLTNGRLGRATAMTQRQLQSASCVGSALRLTQPTHQTLPPRATRSIGGCLLSYPPAAANRWLRSAAVIDAPGAAGGKPHLARVGLDVLGL